jgi:hypothetical protein
MGVRQAGANCPGTVARNAPAAPGTLQVGNTLQPIECLDHFDQFGLIFVHGHLPCPDDRLLTREEPAL